MGKIKDWATGKSLRTAQTQIVDDIIARGPSAPIETRSAPSAPPPPGYLPRTPGTPATVETAMTLSVVYRSVSILTTIISQLDLTVLNSVGKPMVRLPDIIARPDYTMPLSTFLKITVTSLAQYGNAYWRLYRSDENAVPSRVEVLNPKWVAITYDADNNKTYVYKDRQGKQTTLQPWQISHLKLMVNFDGADIDYGSGPIQRCADEIQMALDLRDYGRRVFDEYPTGVVSIEGDLDPDMRAEYRDAWYAEQANGQRVRFMGNKAVYQQMEQNPENTQYVSAQRLADAKIARAFGMSPITVLVEDVSNKTYTNMQDVDKALIRNTVEEYLTAIESALTDLLPASKTVKFNTEAWLRALTINEPAAAVGAPEANTPATSNEGGPVDENPVPN